MNDRIFLRKYRVFAAEIEAVGDFSNSPLAYDGVEIEGGRKVAVEVFPATSLNTTARQRLEAEAIAAMKLRHVNIPVLYDFGVEDDHLVYVTEGFDGTLAEEWVATYGPMPAGPVLRIASQVVSALGAAAFHRIVHHAINPGNLMLMPGETAEGEWPLVKVLHFVGGAANMAAFEKSSPYASPEQLQRGAIGFRSEIYSLGCTIWFLLAGAPPPTASKGAMAAQTTKIGLAGDKLSGVPKDFRRLLAQMLSENPDERPGDPPTFYRQLQDCLTALEGRETMARPLRGSSSSPTRLASEPRRWRVPATALALAALLLAIAAIAGLVLPGYVRHRQAVRADELIGSPTGVPGAQAQTTPATALADSDVRRSLPAMGPEPAKPPSAGPDSSNIVSTIQVEVPTVPKESPNRKATVAAAKEITRHEIRHAQPAEDKLRRAEPASPGEGPVHVARMNALSAQQRSSVLKTEGRHKVEVPKAKATPPNLKRPGPEPKPSPRPRAKEPDGTAKKKRKADDSINMPQLMPDRGNDVMSRPPP